MATTPHWTELNLPAALSLEHNWVEHFKIHSKIIILPTENIDSNELYNILCLLFFQRSLISMIFSIKYNLSVMVLLFKTNFELSLVKRHRKMILTKNYFFICCNLLVKSSLRVFHLSSPFSKNSTTSISLITFHQNKMQQNLLLFQIS